MIALNMIFIFIAGATVGWVCAAILGISSLSDDRTEFAHKIFKFRAEIERLRMVVFVIEESQNKDKCCNFEQLCNTNKIESSDLKELVLKMKTEVEELETVVLSQEEYKIC